MATTYVQLSLERLVLVGKVGTLKRQAGLPIVDQVRECCLFQQLRKNSPLPVELGRLVLTKQIQAGRFIQTVDTVWKHDTDIATLRNEIARTSWEIMAAWPRQISAEQQEQYLNIPFMMALALSRALEKEKDLDLKSWQRSWVMDLPAA